MTVRTSMSASKFWRMFVGVSLCLSTGALAGAAIISDTAGHSNAHSMSELAHRLESRLQAIRENPDPRLYVQIEALLRELEQRYPDQARSALLRAWYEMTQHRFLSALVRLRGLHGKGIDKAIVLGLMSDALVETGAYDDAVEVTQEMLARSPGLPAMARAAHLRFLHGDLDGAIAFYRLALDDRRADAAAKAWVRLQMADLYLHGGKTDEAEQEAKLASPELRVAAKAILARVRVQQGRLADGLRQYEEVLRLQPNPEYALAAYELAGYAHDARALARQRLLLEGMARLDREGLHRRVFAALLADLPGQSGRAVGLALQEYAERPDLYSHLSLAWALYRNGNLPAAREHCEAALRLGTPDPMLRYRASLILAVDDPKRAARLRQQALAILPYLAGGDSATEAAALADTVGEKDAIP